MIIGINFLSFLFFCFILALILSISYFLNPLRKLIRELNGKINAKGQGVFSFYGKEFYIAYHSESRNSSPEFKIAIEGSFGGWLLIRKENSQDRFYKQIGLNRELQVFDRTDNDKLYFECDDQEFLNHIFLNSTTKSRIYEFLKIYSDIQITPERCLLRRYPSPPLSMLSKESVLQSAKELFEFSSLIPTSGGSHPELIGFKTKQAFLYIISTLVLIAGCLSWLWAELSFRVIDPMRLWSFSLSHCIVIVFVGLCAAFILIRGFSTSSKFFIYFIITFCIGVVLCGRYGTAVYNGFFDSSKVEKFDQVVINKYQTHGESSTYYHLVVAPWRHNMPEWSFTVSFPRYQSTIINTTQYRILTKAGRLGFEWEISHQLISKEKKQYSNISTVYWPLKDYRNWYPLPKHVEGIDSQELWYWQQWISIIEEGITNRMNEHDALTNSNFNLNILKEYTGRQELVLSRLSHLEAPERLRAFQDQVLQAGHDQISFYKDYAQKKSEDDQVSFESLRNNTYLIECDRKLWAAYHYFQSLYPSRSKSFNDAVERRLAWFDII